jgi:hypothetical protein
MDIVGPVSGHRKNTLVLYLVMLIAFGIWCTYDGYFNTAFIAKHTEDGRPNQNLVFNRYAPLAMVGGAAIMGMWLFRIRGIKVVATATELIVSGQPGIPYDSIEQIDKTHFEKKGFFVITYKTDGGTEASVRLDDRHYDNLGPILDRLVEKIS